MKILVVGHSYVVDSNRQFWNQAARFENVKVDMIVPKKWNSNLIKKLSFNFNQSTDSFINKIFPVSVYKSGNGSFYHYSWTEIYKLLNNESYESIFIFQETWSFSLAQIILIKQLSRNRKTPIHLAVCQNIIKPKLAWLIPWERFLCSFVRRIWVCTYEILKVLDYKKITNETKYLPFTFDQEIYHANIKHLTNVVKIGFIGRWTEEKGILDLVKACEQLIEEGVQLELHLAGGGELNDQLTSGFIIKHGLIPHVEAHNFYQKIDILVLPSRTKKFWKEQFGRVLVESTASGTPVIGSSSGAIPEVINFIGFGKVFNEGNIEDLKLKILSLIEDMKAAEYNQKMEASISNTIKFSSHKSVAHDLIAQMKLDQSV